MKFLLSASVNLLLIHLCSHFFANLTQPESSGGFLHWIFIALTVGKEGFKWLTNQI